MSDELAYLRGEIERLSLLVAGLHQAPTGRDDGRFRVVLAKRTGTKQWTERIVSAGAIVDMHATGNPRKCTSDTAASAIIDRSGTSFLVEFRDATGLRYIEIGGSTTLVKVTGNLTGGGKYSGVLWAQPSATTVASTGNLTEAEIGQTSAQVMILNAAEVGQSTHDLTAGTPKVSIFQAHLSTAVSTDATPKPIYVIVGIDWENCA